jgi:hypothetical protein
MILKKFEDGDLLYNTVNVAPKNKFFITNGKAYLRTQNITKQDIEDGESLPTGIRLFMVAGPRPVSVSEETTNGFLDFSNSNNSQYIPLL